MAVHPSTMGMGWVAFEGPLAPYDWGIVRPKRDKNTKCLRRLEWLIERLRPETLVIEAFAPEVSMRGARVQLLYRGIVSLATDRGLAVCVYSRGDVRACFASVGAQTREEIAEAVVRHVDAFRHRLPSRRKPWQHEDVRIALFSAAALAITHFQLDAGRLLEDLGL